MDREEYLNLKVRYDQITADKKQLEKDFGMSWKEMEDSTLNMNQKKIN